MSHVPHELAEDFPQHTARISQLKSDDGHFASLADRYHGLNRAIHRAETNVEPTDDAHMQDIRKQRMLLKDQIAKYLD